MSAYPQSGLHSRSAAQDGTFAALAYVGVIRCSMAAHVSVAGNDRPSPMPARIRSCMIRCLQRRASRAADARLWLFRRSVSAKARIMHWRICEKLERQDERYEHQLAPQFMHLLSRLQVCAGFQQTIELSSACLLSACQTEPATVRKISNH
jgi:hypothetical protein